MSDILVVQRGHVARTSGATGAPGEQRMARRNAAELLDVARNLPDVTPRIIDADEPNSRYAGDRFISFHGDASANGAARGASVGYRNERGRALGARWKELWATGFDGGFRDDNYTVNLARYYGTGHAISAGNPDAVIVEHGFMTNVDDRAFIESDAGVKLAACVAVAAAFPQYDLDRLLGSAPEPEQDDEPEPPPSTEPSATVITVDDEGEDVRAWQRQLQALLGDGALPRWGADGIFGAETTAATVRAYRLLGLTASDPSAPVVGPRSRSAMEKALADQAKAPAAPAWRGKAVRAKVDLRFYDSPRWTNPVGRMQAGHRFPTIEARLAVGGGHQYRVRNSRGAGPFYVTAAPRFVDLV